MLAATNLIGFGTKPDVGPSAPLDGISGTVKTAFSWSRKLLTSYSGEFSREVSGDTDRLFDQKGTKHLNQTTVNDRPLLTTAGGQSRACGSFDSSSEFLQGSGMGSYISAGTGYIIISAIIDTIDSDAENANALQIFGQDTSGNGILFRTSTGTPNGVNSWNYDGSDDNTAGIDISTGAEVVIEWRHESGTLYCRLNGANEVSVSSGNTSFPPASAVMAASEGDLLACKVFELVTFTTIPTLSDRNALEANMRSHIVS